jgi:hypothetical protein
MKHETMVVTLCVIPLCVGGVRAACDATNDVSRLEPQYVAQTNGMFAICALDPVRGVLLRVKGLEISRSQLPQWGRDCVYELGERPSVDSKSWKVPKEYHHFYGKLPYPVKDIDPVLSSYWDRGGSLLIGVRLRGRFYAMENLGQIQRNPTATRETELQPPLDIVEVKPPRHRTDDVRVFSTQERLRCSSKGP